MARDQPGLLRENRRWINYFEGINWCMVTVGHDDRPVSHPGASLWEMIGLEASPTTASDRVHERLPRCCPGSPQQQPEASHMVVTGSQLTSSNTAPLFLQVEFSSLPLSPYNFQLLRPIALFIPHKQMRSLVITDGASMASLPCCCGLFLKIKFNNYFYS